MLVVEQPAVACHTTFFDVKNHASGEIRKHMQIHVEDWGGICIPCIIVCWLAIADLRINWFLLFDELNQLRNELVD